MSAEAWVVRAYRALARLFPAEIRERDGDEMVATFEDLWSEAARPAARARLAWIAFGRLPLVAATEWRDVLQARRATSAPLGWAAVAGGLVFLLYVLTLAPSTAFWDASEYIAAGHTLGIPHPPGNPLFVLLARTWITLLAPTGLSVAVRVNLFAAAASALSAGFVFLIAHRVLRSLIPTRRMALIGAGAATLLSATAFTVWNQSTVNEKVYTISVLIITAVSWLAVCWYDRRDRATATALPLLAVYLLALGATNHLMSVLVAPALVLLVLTTAPSFLWSGRFWARAVAVGALGLSVNFVLPIRSVHAPVINEGEPTCESVASAAVAIYTNGGSGCAALSSTLRREQYGKPPVTQRMSPFGAQLLNYFQYFDWQWSRGLDPSEVPGNARLAITMLFLVLGGLGLVGVHRADRHLFGYLLTLALTLSFGLVFYLNFKYGYSLYPNVGWERQEVRERDYFFVASFALWGMLAGIGLTLAWSALAERIRSERRWALASPVLALALLPLALNWGWATRSDDWAARDWAYDLLMSVEPYAVLFTNGDNDTFPLWYVQEVEGIRPDVTVIVGQYLDTLWYPKQLQKLTTPGRQRAYEQVADVDLYASEAPPADPILSIEPALLDRILDSRLESELTVAFPSLAVTYPEGTYLDRQHLMALAIIRDSVEQRPIYFAASTNLMGELGLERWGVRHGLARKLVLGDPPVESPGLVRVADELGGEVFDVPRSLALYQRVYRYRGLKDRRVWADRPSLGIPTQFYYLALQLADGVARSGGAVSVIGQLQADAAAFGVTAAGGSVE